MQFWDTVRARYMIVVTWYSPEGVGPNVYSNMATNDPQPRQFCNGAGVVELITACVVVMDVFEGK